MFTFSTKNNNHGESVYNLVQQSERDKKRMWYPTGPSQYVSRYACKVRKEACCRKTGAYKTMGCISVFPNQPHRFLKKFTGGSPCFWKYKDSASKPTKKESLVENKICQKCCCSKSDTTPLANPSIYEKCCIYGNQNSDSYVISKTRGSHSQPFLSGRTVSCQTENDVPWIRNFSKNNNCYGGGGEGFIEEDECCKYGEVFDNCNCPNSKSVKERVPISWNGDFSYIERGDKDYIRDNAVAAMRSPPKIPERRFVDHRSGFQNEWIPEKLLGQEGFGQVPKYLCRVKNELYQKDLEMKNYIQMEADKRCRALTTEEREMILKGLQMTWKEIFSEYQRLPLSSMSPKIAKRKKELEDELTSVEKDIQLFNRNGPLFVADVIKSQYINK